MLDLLQYYFNLPFWGVIAFGGKFLFLLFLISIATRTTRIVYRVHIRRPIKRWLNRKSHKERKHERNQTA